MENEMIAITIKMTLCDDITLEFEDDDFDEFFESIKKVVPEDEYIIEKRPAKL
jgi:hypothetical protein